MRHIAIDDNLIGSKLHDRSRVLPQRERTGAV